MQDSSPIIGFGRLNEGEEESHENIMRALRKALEPLGGMEAFVRRGSRVLLKPNQTLYLSHKDGSTTSPLVMRGIVQLCRHAGAREVWIAEAVGHAQQSRQVMDKTGMVAGGKEAGATLIYMDEIAHDVYDFGDDAGDLRYMPAPEIMDRADVVINVPKAKTHFIDPISGACKNWVGVMPMSYRLTLQRRVEAYYRGNALLLRKFRPHLNIFDGAWAGEGQGPGSNDGFWWGWILAGTDPVAADVTLARLFGLDHANIRMANEAAKFGVGVNDLDRITWEGATYEEAHVDVKPADPSVHRFPCRVIVGEGPGATMEGTLGHWKTIADGWLKYGVWNLLTLKGTPTFLVGNADDPDFEQHVSEGPYVVLDDAAQDRYKYDDRVVFVPGSPVPQSYMQNEMISGMGFSGIYHAGQNVQKQIEKFKNSMRATA